MPKLCARGKRAAQSRYDKYPSAYANGHAVRVCKGDIAGLDGKKKASGVYVQGGGYLMSKGGLAEWFGENDGKGWVDCKTGKPCGRKKGEKRGYPACRPTMAQCKTSKPKQAKTSGKRVEWTKPPR
jgi:hypothetical protein